MTEEIRTIPQPYPSWVWHEESQGWVTPNGKSVPGDGKPYQWNEEAQDWIEVTHN